MRKIIERYNQDTDGSPFLLPILHEEELSLRQQYLNALKRQNRQLRQIATIAGITKQLTTHVSRHSWATIAKGERLPLWVISEGLGHSSEKTTYTYLASFDRSVMDKAVDRVSAAVRRAG